MHTLLQRTGEWLVDWASGRRRKRLEMRSQLFRVIETLEAFLEWTEPRFLELGRIFQDIHSRTGAFTDQVVASMDSLRGENTEFSLTGVGDYVTRCATDLSVNQETLSRSLSYLDKVLAALDGLSRICGDTDKIPILLNVIALNIGIECNRSDTSRDMFTVFTDEVRALSLHMKDVVGRLHSESDSVRHGHRAATDDIRRGLKGLDSVNASRKDACCVSLMTSVSP